MAGCKLQVGGAAGCCADAACLDPEAGGRHPEAGEAKDARPKTQGRGGGRAPESRGWGVSFGKSKTPFFITPPNKKWLPIKKQRTTTRVNPNTCKHSVRKCLKSFSCWILLFLILRHTCFFLLCLLASAFVVSGIVGRWRPLSRIPRSSK